MEDLRHDPKALAEKVVAILDLKKARGIKLLHVADKTVLADYFVICTGNSNTQTRALGDEVEYKLGLRGVDPVHYEGRDNNNWVVVDYGSVILHIFSGESRDFYKLEKLYGDAKAVHFQSIDEKAAAKGE